MCLLWLYLASSIVVAQPALDSPFPPEEFRARLERLLDAIGPEGVAVLKGAPRPDNFRPFRQYNNFYYFTGWVAPGAVLLVDGTRGQVTLYDGQVGQAVRERLAERGIDRVVTWRAFAGELTKAAQRARVLYVPYRPGEGRAQAQSSFTNPRALLPGYRPVRDVEAFRKAVSALAERLGVSVRPVEPLIDPLRRVKSEREIELMREAARLAAEAIRTAIENTKPGILEAELAGLCELTYLKHGAFGSAWTPIVASGPNMTELHYMKNNRRLQPGDMLLLDTGPDYHYYTADLTRCWPVTGDFPEPYRELYEKLVQVHRAGIEAVRPGNTAADVLLAMRRRAEALGIGRYLLPVAGHYTGMAVHDVGRLNEPFVPGVVFNVEPLLMVPDQNLHMRLEDTVLCTEEGPEVLTPLDRLPWDRKAILEIRDAQ